MHEIITLQLGQRSNYLATHFWNTQESYFTYTGEQESIVDHDIHFRPGIGADGSETFMPRTVIYDLKGGFGSLRKINALYEIDEPASSQGLWSGSPVVHRQTAIQQNAYQRSLEEGTEPAQLTPETVRYWSDFNRVFYHPKSIVQLNDYELNSTLMPFESWDTGEDLFNSLDKEHDILDRDLRPFAEEADQMQGIQIMASIDDSWGGFAAKYVDRLRDEYGKTAIWFWGGEESIKAAPREKRLLRLSNTARSLSEIAVQVSMVIPMALPSKLPNYLSMGSNTQWQRSALFSTALESAMLPTRLRLHQSSRTNFDQLANALNINGNQNIAKIQMTVTQESALNGDNRAGRLEVRAQSRDLRVPSQDRDTVHAVTEDTEVDVRTPDIDFFPTETGEQTRGRQMLKKAHVFGQAENYRVDQKELREKENDESDDGYERARRRAAGLPIIQRTKVALRFPLIDSFPRIFANTNATSSVAVTTSLLSDTTVAARLRALEKVVNSAVTINDREALANSLGEMAEAYEDGWDSGSDEDDD